MKIGFNRSKTETAYVFLFVTLISLFFIFLSNSSYASSYANSPVFIKGYANVYFFWQEGCPHCHAEWLFLQNLSKSKPIHIYSFEIRDHPKNRTLYFEACSIFGLKPLGTPMTFVGSSKLVGFSNDNFYRSELLGYINNCIYNGCYDKLYSFSKNNSFNSVFLNSSSNDSCSGSSMCFLPGVYLNSTNNSNQNSILVPILGKLEVSKISMPVFTIVIAGLDSFNPCAMWVLTFLLTLLVYSGSRKKMLFVGLIFVFSSGLIYFLFMTAWLNLFLIIGYTNLIRIIVGVVAVFMGAVDLKDSFWFKKGISFTIPDSAKPNLFKKMRKVVNEAKDSELLSLSVVLGTVALAATANLIEFACTAGFPAIYTRVLTLKHLSLFSYYSYLILYNLIYVIPLLIIVLIFSFTLGAHKFSERSGRIMKFVGGLLMFILGLILIFKPSLLVLK